MPELTAKQGGLREGMRPKNWQMAREDWYLHLASTNRRIVEARERIQDQKALICSLKEKGYCAGSALLQLFEQTLQLSYTQRETILEKVRTYALPVCVQHGLHCVSPAKCDGPEPLLGAYFRLTR